MYVFQGQGHNNGITGNGSFINLLYDLELGMPPPQNVLIPSIFISLRLGYKRIIILGADLSWHKSLVLDSHNRVCYKYGHFYDKNPELKLFGEDSDSNHSNWKMSTIFASFSKMFDGFLILEEYSKYLGSKIYNSSSSTSIDAFERRSLSELLE